MCKREGKRGERGGEGREQRRRARSPPSANARSLGESPSANAAEPIEKNLPARSAIAEWKMRAQGGEGGGEGAEANPAGSYACMSCFSLDPPFLHLSLSHPSPIAFSLAPLLYPPPTTEKGRQRSAPRARGGVLRQGGGTVSGVCCRATGGIARGERSRASATAGVIPPAAAHLLSDGVIYTQGT